MKAQYNIDSSAIEISLPDGTEVTVRVNEIMDDMNLSARQQGEFTRLMYDYPLELADLLLAGKLEEYLRSFAREQQSQEEVISAQLQAQGYSTTQSDALARKFLRYDS
jgi:hypothetical protein